MFGNRAKLIYITIITLSLGFNFYQFFFPDEEYIEQYENQIALLEVKVDSLKDKNLGLYKEVDLLEIQVKTLDNQVAEVEEKRKSIIRSYEIYLQQITDLDDSELERWILARYNDRTGTQSSTVSY